MPTPAKNSYDEIDRIEEECLVKLAGIDGYKIVVTSMGCSGRALQKRLWNKQDNIFLFDFGSLMDAICGWGTRDWINLTHFDTQEFMKALKKELSNVKNNQIKIMCTSALIPVNYDMRKEEYHRSFKKIRQYGYEPYIVEAFHCGTPSYLEEYSNHVFYSCLHNNNLSNKGVNEAVSMIECLRHFKFNDNQMIVKLTGRYLLESPEFLRLIENNPEIDMFVKCLTAKEHWDYALTGCLQSDATSLRKCWKILI